MGGAGYGTFASCTTAFAVLCLWSSAAFWQVSSRRLKALYTTPHKPTQLTLVSVECVRRCIAFSRLASSSLLCCHACEPHFPLAAAACGYCVHKMSCRVRDQGLSQSRRRSEGDARWSREKSGHTLWEAKGRRLNLALSALAFMLHATALGVIHSSCRIVLAVLHPLERDAWGVHLPFPMLRSLPASLACHAIDMQSVGF